MAPVSKRQRLHESSAETRALTHVFRTQATPAESPPTLIALNSLKPFTSEFVGNMSNTAQRAFYYLGWWGCPVCLTLTRGAAYCSHSCCLYVNGDIVNYGRKLLGWQQLSHLPTHEEDHRREEKRRRYIYLNHLEVIDRQQGKIITEDDMLSEDMELPGVLFYDDGNEDISDETREYLFLRDGICRKKFQRYFIVQKRVYDSFQHHFISLETFKQRMEDLDQFET